jgi:hypothetical protein
MIHIAVEVRILIKTMKDMVLVKINTVLKVLATVVVKVRISTVIHRLKIKEQILIHQIERERIAGTL